MRENITFVNRSDEKISGVMHVSETQPVLAYAIFAHCFTCSKNINAAVHIAEELATQGIATLRFDFTGLGSSSGDFTETNFSSNVQDIVDAAEFLKSEYRSPELLVGHSLGGTAMLAAATHIESAKAVATLGSPATPEHVLHHFHAQMHEIENHGEAEVDLAGRTFTFNKSFVDDAKAYEINLEHLNKALLVMHSPIDSTVSVDEAATIYQKARHPKSFISLENADHLLSKNSDSVYASKVLAAWAVRYISAVEINKNKLVTQDEKVVASADTNKGFYNQINANGHNLTGDEPLSFGGTNYGPSPYDYLSTALGTCTTMTLNMYARHKKLPVANVTVTVQHNKQHAEDCVECENNQQKVDVFTRKIKISGELTEEQRQRMLQIADRCPVHQTIHNNVEVKSILSD